jgi:ketosteroid isomerase-like protein
MSARETLNKLNEALVKNDNETAMQYYSPDAEMVTPEGTFKGRDEIKKWFNENSEAFSGFDMTVHNKIETDDKAVDEWTMTMKHTGSLVMPGFGESIPATNKDVTMNGVDVVTVNDDLIVSHHVYYDQKNFADQLGLEPEA